MSLEHVVLPTLAVAGTWLCVGVLLAGCGYLTRRALLPLLPRSSADGLRVADVWVGLAGLLAYLQVWSLATSVSRSAWIAPVFAGLVGVALAARRAAVRGARLSFAIVALAGLGVLWLANRALASALDYDLGLYHLNAVEYASRFGAIPGLGNLQSRLGSGDAHFLLVAWLGGGPWGGAAPHLANGLLVSFLFADIASRFALRRAEPRPASFSRRMAVLLAPAAIAVIGSSANYRLSSPNLDLAAFVLVAVGALYLAESVESGIKPAAALTSTAAFAAAAVTRPLYWPAAVIVAAMLVFAIARDRGKGPRDLVRIVALVGVLPSVLLLGWMTRQAVLSGYLFFPSTLGGLPVDWRVPAFAVDDQNRWNEAWARRPATLPIDVLSSWNWFPHWLRTRAKDLDVLAPLTLFAVLIPCLVVSDRDRAARRVPMLAVLVPVIVTLVGWFHFAPDPRFALASIWLVPVALLAWALPAGASRPSAIAVVAGALVAYALVQVGVENLGWMALAAFDVWAFAAIATRMLGSPRMRALVAQASLVCVALIPIGLVQHRGAFDVVDATGDGTLGTPAEPVPTLVAFTTSSGLELWQPSGGADQCWRAILCVPQANPHLRLRGADVRDGFSVRP